MLLFYHMIARTIILLCVFNCLQCVLCEPHVIVSEFVFDTPLVVNKPRLTAISHLSSTAFTFTSIVTIMVPCYPCVIRA